MKKILITAFLALFLTIVPQTASAVEDPDPAGTVVMSAHVGPDFVLGIKSGITLGVGGFVTYDYVVADSWWIGHFSLGAAIGGTHVGNIKMSSGVETRANYFVAPRAIYGININESLELHLGLTAGPYLHHDQVVYEGGGKEYSNPNSFKFEIGGTFGARYYLNDHLAASAEINTAVFQPLLAVGIAYRF